MGQRPSIADILAIVLTLLLSFESDIATAAARRALVIGNDAYPEPWQLNSCVNDAKAFAAWLEEVGFEKHEIQVITNANRVQMLGALNTLASATSRQPHDQVVIYYSGHGSKVDDDNGDEEDGQDEVLVAIGGPGDSTSLGSEVVRDDQFYDFLQRIRSRTEQVVVVLDSCFSGGTMKGGLDAPLVRRPTKRIPEAALRRKDGAVAVEPARTDGAEPWRRKALGGSDAPSAFLEQKSSGNQGGLVFLAASSERESASAAGPGEQLSVFTAALLRTVRTPSRSASRDATLASVLAEVQSQLIGVQTPQLVTERVAASTKFTPGLFDDPIQVDGERRFSAILERLIYLPPSNGDASWRLDAHCHPSDKVAIGSAYDLRVVPGRAGFLTVFTVQSDGSVVFLYPNRARPGNLVRAGIEVPIPWEQGLGAAPPAGVERYFVYLLEKNPFEGVDLSQFSGALPVGHLGDIVRRRANIESVAQLRELLERGTGQHGAHGPGRIGWTRKIVSVTTVER